MASELRTEDPTRVGAYELSGRLGEGGQGTVYFGRAEDGTPVAVKVLDQGWGGGEKFRADFAREVGTAQRVAPFCTAALLDADLSAEPPYLVTEYVAGSTLRDTVKGGGPRTGASLDRLAIATATALVAIHQAGVVHRDFKPANVLLGPDGPRVIDFGIARATDATATQTRAGTPAYMAPEQIKGSELTAKVDVFAWACVIAFAARGEPPFAGETMQALLMQIITAEPDLDGVPDKLAPLLRECLDKDPQRRPDAAQLLARLLGSEPRTAAPEDAATILEEGYTVATSELPIIAADATAGHAAEASTAEPRTALGAAGSAPTRQQVPDPAAPPPPTGSGYLRPAPQPEPPPGPYRPAPRRGRGRIAAAAVVGVLLIAALGGWAAMNWLGGGDTPAPASEVGQDNPAGTAPEAVGQDSSAEPTAETGGQDDYTPDDDGGGEWPTESPATPSPWSTDDLTPEPTGGEAEGGAEEE